MKNKSGANKKQEIFSLLSKRGAMEMTVGTIVTIVLLMSALVLGLILTKNIFFSSTENIKVIDDQVKGEINNLFADASKRLVVGLGGQNTAEVKQGTDNFGIPFGFSPDDPRVWGANNQGCKYSVTAANQNSYCIKKGWADVQSSIMTGTTNVLFDEVDGTSGYSLIKISVPEDVPPCLQRFNIVVKCGTATTESSYFDLEVTKKGLL